MQTSAAWRGLEWYLLAGACACLMPPWTLLARDRVIPDCVLTFRTSCALSELKRRSHPAHPTYRVKQLISSLTIWYS